MKNGAIAALLVIAMLAASGAGYLAGNQLAVMRTSTETSWLTATETTLQSSASNSSWKFVVSINATTVESGQSLLLWANLTNTSRSNKTIRPFVEPYINPDVTAANGTVVWAWNPPEVTWLNWNVTSGQALSERVDVSTTNLLAGTYLIEVAPLSSQFSNNFNLTVPFVVQHITHLG